MSYGLLDDIDDYIDDLFINYWKKKEKNEKK